MRVYELTFVVDPRVSDEDVIALTDEYKKMIEDGGGNVPRVENWGRRKLAYSIKKLSEGKYVLLYITTEPGSNPLPAVELRLNQNDKVLRFLTVRTDREQDAQPEPEPEAEAETTEAPAEAAAGEG
ncbi:MAG: 30S ribosomal protein S6 [Deltaproteobacteria bacterium]|nr:30S ribosomal protein S6 [Deltaproteobacteria bacterium]